MKILFLCGSLEDGKDGVGDYTRRLAAELYKQGHRVAAIALNDNHTKELYNGVQQIDGTQLRVLRLPSFSFSLKEKMLVKEWIDNFDPDWMSLQFVPFAFHPKGLSLSLSGLLKFFGGKRKWQIMFHELWVGMDTQATKKERFWGFLQQTIIRRLVKKLKPSINHTQTYLYKGYLNKLGFSVTYLPLFSNIRSYKSSTSAVLPTQNRVGGDAIIFVVFGGIHHGAPIESFAKDIAAYGKEKGISMVLKIAGRFGNEHERWASIWKSEGMPAEILGEKSPEEISDILRAATFGICTTPIALMEKSGSVAALREHGLPIVCLTRKWQPRGVAVDRPKGIFEYGTQNLDDLFTLKTTPGTIPDISEITYQFSNNLLQSS